MSSDPHGHVQGLRWCAELIEEQKDYVFLPEGFVLAYRHAADRIEQLDARVRELEAENERRRRRENDLLTNAWRAGR